MYLVWFEFVCGYTGWKNILFDAPTLAAPPKYFPFGDGYTPFNYMYSLATRQREGVLGGAR